MAEIGGNLGKEAGVEARGTKADDNTALNDHAERKSSSWFDSGLTGKRNQKESEDLADKGTIPKLNIEDSEKSDSSRSLRGWFADKMASDDEKQIFDDFNNLAKKTGHEPLTNTQKLQIENLPEDQKQMYRQTLNELIDLNDGKITPAQYMTNTLSNAADLAEANGREPGSWNLFKPSQGELFKNYVGLVMSEKPQGVLRDTARELAGGGPHIAGSGLETVYQSIVSNDRATEGFNPNVADVDRGNSITHHFREFLVVGYNSGKGLADWAATQIDSPVKNPGDVRDGYFASMLGAGLYSGKVTAREAANLTAWAYTDHGGTQPPWGAENVAGNYLDADKDYKIEDWLKAYRERQE